MKIMLFCHAEEMKTELLYWAGYLAEMSQDFVITPLIRLKDKGNYEETISQLSQTSRNISVDPIYLKSPDSRFSNLVNLSILFNDFLSIFEVIKRSKPNVIVCFYILHAYPLVLLKRIFKFSLCVVAFGSDVGLENNSLQKFVKRTIYRNCELIFARSNKMKDAIEKECNRNVVVVPSAADTSFFRPLDSKRKLRRKWGIQPRDRVILTVCRLDKNKGVDILIRSLRELNSNDVNLLVVGEGAELKALRELSSTLRIQENVTFLGFRQREELLELYNLANVFALASYSEGLPRVLIEAMACECIPIVTDVGDAAAVVSDGFNGFIFSPGDCEKLAEKIREVFCLSEESLKLIQNRTRRAVENSFDTRELIKKMINSIDALRLYRGQYTPQAEQKIMISGFVDRQVLQIICCVARSMFRKTARY